MAKPRYFVMVGIAAALGACALIPQNPPVDVPELEQELAPYHVSAGDMQTIAILIETGATEQQIMGMVQQAYPRQDPNRPSAAELRTRLNVWLGQQYWACASDMSQSFEQCSAKVEARYHETEAKEGLSYLSIDDVQIPTTSPRYTAPMPMMMPAGAGGMDCTSYAIPGPLPAMTATSCY